MNQDRIQGRWKQLKGKVKEQWGKLTDDDLDVIDGRRDQLLGRIQARHGLARDEADSELQVFESRNPEFRFDDGGETVGTDNDSGFRAEKSR
ncbi:MAG TPA: CsbD family protein [Ramlibacter sp.]|jgi:uncharacterized protein YjbJ (UPF0337 family)